MRQINKKIGRKNSKLNEIEVASRTFKQTDILNGRKEVVSAEGRTDRDGKYIEGEEGTGRKHRGDSRRE